MPASTGGPRQFLPGMFAPGRDTFYQFWRALNPLAYPVLSIGSLPNLGILNGDLLFAANDGVTGIELWRVPTPEPPPPFLPGSSSGCSLRGRRTVAG